MYDIDRALRRLEMAERLEELDKRRSTSAGPSTPPSASVPSPSPVPETSAQLDVVDPDGTTAASRAAAEPAAAHPEPAGPRTLPNGLPVRTPGTRFRTQPKLAPSTVVIPIGTPLTGIPIVGSSSSGPGSAAASGPGDATTLRSRPVTGWGADHDVVTRRPAIAGRADEVAPGPTQGPTQGSTQSPTESPAENPTTPPGAVATRPGLLPVSELLAGLLTPAPAQPITRPPRGAFTPLAALQTAPAPVSGAGLGWPDATSPTTADHATADASVGEPDAGGQVEHPETEAAGPEPAEPEPAEPEADSHQSHAAERIAAMLRDGRPGLLA